MSTEVVGPSKLVEDASVDVLESSRSRDIELVAKEDPDATDYSSSFANTTSGNGNNSGLSDTEVESQFFSENHVAPFDELNCVFPTRKKKLTSHWRNFIRPLMWRCKWTELRIKELESQASKYTRIISSLYRKKDMALDKVLVEESGSRSLPFTYLSHRKIALKRRKRSRVEDKTDIASYMSNHILFSERENKRPDMDGGLSLEDLDTEDQNAAGNDEFDIIDDCIFPEDDSNVLERVLCKIESVHNQVHKLKAQLDSLMINNVDKFSSSENLSQLMACDGQTSSVRSPTFYDCDEDMVSGLHSQHLLDYDLKDFIMHDSAVSSYGEVFPIPDITESTVGLLSSIDVTQLEVQVGDSSEMIVDSITSHYEAVEVDGSSIENVHDQSVKKSPEADYARDEDINYAVHLALEPDVVSKPVILQEHLSLKSHLLPELQIPKNKRKRGERKASSGNWSRQRPGEPDG